MAANDNLLDLGNPQSVAAYIGGLRDLISGLIIAGQRLEAHVRVLESTIDLAAAALSDAHRLQGDKNAQERDAFTRIARDSVSNLLKLPVFDWPTSSEYR
ncbi:MAG: hypothetical protein WDM91_10880 [Rhizomicrobium sp.]